jgi:hypothetical protein
MFCRKNDPNQCQFNGPDELNSKIGKVPPADAVLCFGS